MEKLCFQARFSFVSSFSGATCFKDTVLSEYWKDSEKLIEHMLHITSLRLISGCLWRVCTCLCSSCGNASGFCKAFHVSYMESRSWPEWQGLHCYWVLSVLIDWFDLRFTALSVNQGPLLWRTLVFSCLNTLILLADNRIWIILCEDLYLKVENLGSGLSPTKYFLL